MRDMPFGSKGCPVHYDHESPDHANNWPDTYAEMQEKCPIAWTEAHGGFWVATRYKDIVAMAQNDALFSSFKTYDPETMATTGGITIPENPIPRGLPVESDRPQWDMFRGFINRQFAPRAAEARRANIRKYATHMLDRVIETGEMDLVNDFTGPVTALATMELMGLPLAEWKAVSDPLHQIVYVPRSSPEHRQVAVAVGRVFERCMEEYYKAKQEPPKDGLISYFAHGTLDGRPLRDDEVMSYCNNILAGGVDTTTALTTHALGWLHDHPEQKQRLIDDPSLLPVAREEFIRYFTPIHALARNATDDTVVNDMPIDKGDRMLLVWAAANRDPEIFDNPQEIDMTRFPNRHIGFGAGMHRCIGSFMARVMFEEMVTQMLSRIPEYSIDHERSERYTSTGTINGWINMPITFAPGPRVGTDLDL